MLIGEISEVVTAQLLPESVSFAVPHTCWKGPLTLFVLLH